MKRLATTTQSQDAADGMDDANNNSTAEEQESSGESPAKKGKQHNYLILNNNDEDLPPEIIGDVNDTADETLIIQQVGKRSDSDHITLCDKSIILFVGDKNEQVRKDVTDTIMLAQLAADKAVQKIKTANGSAPMAVECVRTYFKAFVDMFHHCNWVSTGFSVDEVKVTGTDMSIDKVLIEIIESIGNKEEQDKLKKTLGVLKAIPQDDNRLVLFKQRTMERSYQQFLVHSVIIDKRGSATMKSVMFGINTKEQVTNVLWFKWSNGGTEVYKTEHIMMLGARAFDATRAVVLQKLQTINETYINQIEI